MTRIYADEIIRTIIRQLLGSAAYSLRPCLFLASCLQIKAMAKAYENCVLRLATEHYRQPVLGILSERNVHNNPNAAAPRTEIIQMTPAAP